MFTLENKNNTFRPFSYLFSKMLDAAVIENFIFVESCCTLNESIDFGNLYLLIFQTLNQSNLQYLN